MQYRVNLIANQPVRQDLFGRTFLIVDTGVAPSLDLKIEVAGFATEEFRGVRRGLKVRSQQGFTSCLLTSEVDCVVELVTSYADISIDYAEGNSVNATIVGTPDVFVTNDAGSPLSVTIDTPISLGNTPDTPLFVSTIAYAAIVALTDNAPVTASDVAVALCFANSGRPSIRFLNLGPDPVALGSSGITWASRTIVLYAGDVWVEESAAGRDWYGICDTGKTANITRQEVTL